MVEIIYFCCASCQSKKGTFTYYVTSDILKTQLRIRDRTALSEKFQRRQGFSDVTQSCDMCTFYNCILFYSKDNLKIETIFYKPLFKCYILFSGIHVALCLH